METEYDREQFLKSIGRPIRIDNRPMYGVFESAPNELDFERSFDSSEYTLTILSTNAELVERGSMVEIDGRMYEVATKPPDHEGMTEMRLVEP